jgi:hypothetical protein
MIQRRRTRRRLLIWIATLNKSHDEANFWNCDVGVVLHCSMRPFRKTHFGGSAAALRTFQCDFTCVIEFEIRFVLVVA